MTKNYLWFITILIALIVTSCQPSAPTAEVEITVGTDNIASNPAEPGVSLDEGLIDDEPEEMTTASPEPDDDSGNLVDEPISKATATPDLRMRPEDWQQWPIVPTLSTKAKEIYLRGLAIGNDPQSFSKVGDCQAIKEVLMGIYDLPGRYAFAERDEALQEAVDQFSGSFNRDGMAVKGGFNAATVLSPMWADPEVCLAGENPLECEFRVHRPSMVIISLEVWWKGRTPERYEQYLRNIIELSIDHGVLPILSTKADNVEGDHSINLVNAKLAYEYDIPLWNFWLAAQPLAYHGIDPERDGFHITVEAWNIRSFTALQTIDALWRQANVGDTITIVEKEPEPSATSTLTAMMTPGMIDVPDEVSGTLIFQMDQRNADGNQSMGIFEIDFDGGTFRQLLPLNSSLLAVGDDGRMLVSSSGAYQIIVGSRTVDILTTEFNQSLDGAYWTANGDLIAAGKVGDQVGIFSYQSEQDHWSLLIDADDVIRLYPNSTEHLIHWASGVCSTDRVCEVSGYHQYDLRMGNTVKLSKGADPKANHHGTLVVYRNSVNDRDMLLIESVNGVKSDQIVDVFGDILLDYEWSPDGDRIAVTKMIRSDYFGKASEVLHYVVNTENFAVKEYPNMLGLNPMVVWSPDAMYLLTSGTQSESAEGPFFVQLRLLDLSSQSTKDIFKSQDLISDDFVSVSSMYWVK